MELSYVVHQIFPQHVNFVASWVTQQRKAAHTALNHLPVVLKRKKDYSGFNDRNSWLKRLFGLHRLGVARISRSKTNKQKKELERTLGVRYTKLLDLPYYSSALMCTIDLMYNLFFGTVKHLFKTWIEKGNYFLS